MVNDQTPRFVIDCRECGRPMCERVNSGNSSRFLGCSGFPDCKHTEQLPEYLTLLRSGAPQLPGMEGL